MIAYVTSTLALGNHRINMKSCPQYFEWQKNFYIDLLNGLILDLKLAFNVIDQSDYAQKNRIPIMSSPNVNTQERKCL